MEKIECTMDDAYYLYDKCYYNNKNELVQTYYPLWNIPHVCNDNGHSTPPYSNYTLPCGTFSNLFQINLNVYFIMLIYSTY